MTPTSHEIFGLHVVVFWICAGLAVVVFGVMLYSQLRFRHSQERIPGTGKRLGVMAEIAWTAIPVVIVVLMALPAANTILKPAAAPVKIAATSAIDRRDRAMRNP